MWKKATIGGLAATAIVAGGAGVAIARAQSTSAPAAATSSATGTATTPATSSSGQATAAKRGKSGDPAREVFGNLNLKDFQHAEWVTKSGANAPVTHEAILGTVTAVSSSSVTVKAADGTTMTFAVDAQTRVREPKPRGKATNSAPTGAPTSSPTGAPTSSPATPPPSITDVRAGQTVLVGGVRSPDLIARAVVVRTR